MSCPPAVSYMGGQEEEEEGEGVRSNTSLSSELAQRQEGGHKSQPVDMSQVRGQQTPGKDEEMGVFAGEDKEHNMSLFVWPGHSEVVSMAWS